MEIESRCVICCNSFSNKPKSKWKKINCPFCNFECCYQCIEKYLFFTATDLHCMKCEKVWSRRIISEIFPKYGSLQKKWNSRRSEILLESQKEFLVSETHGMIQYYRNVQNQIDEMKMKLEKTKEDIEKYTHMSLKSMKVLREENPDFVLKKKDIVNMKRDKNKELRGIENRIYELTTRLTRIELGFISVPQEKYVDVERQNFIHPCSAPKCKGFLSTAWKCGLCDFYTCPKCFDFVGKVEAKSTHVCSENDVKSAEEIKRNGKKCPNCGVFIVRISGCATMFCTNCGVGFHWDTLKIYTKGIVYNPHYFEYHRIHGDGPRVENVVCGRLITPAQIKPIMDKCNESEKKMVNEEGKEFVVDHVFFKTYLFSLHNRNEHELTYWRREMDTENQLRRLRFLYMMNLMTSEDWKSRLLSLDKLQTRNTEFVQILEMNIASSNDVLRQLIDMKITPIAAFYQLYSLECYTQKIFEDVGKIYSTKKRPGNQSYDVFLNLMNDNVQDMVPVGVGHLRRQVVWMNVDSVDIFMQ